MANSRICSIPKCGKPHIARGYCKSHYNRFMDHGDPLAGIAPKGVPLQWIIDHIGHSSDQCLTWPFGTRADGRGAILIDGRHQYAHRHMCLLAHGEAPSPDYETAHSCGRGHFGCVNPKHLRWATRSENCNDRTIHGTQNRGERCGNAKLTETDVRTIRSLQGIEDQRELASRFGVTATTIGSIHNRKLWGWLV